jgi:hypothetical protein
MPTELRPSAAALRAAELIDSKRSSAAYAHACAGYDCAACSWRTDDIDEVAAIIDGETNYPELHGLLEYFDNLRREVETGMRSKSGHPLANFHENGRGKQLYSISIPIGIFDRIRTFLGQQKLGHDTATMRFLLRPLRLPQEAHTKCSTCESGALMAKESGAETSYLCYLSRLLQAMGYKLPTENLEWRGQLSRALAEAGLGLGEDGQIRVRLPEDKYWGTSDRYSRQESCRHSECRPVVDELCLTKR